MTKQPTPEQQRRRRRAAFELRQRAADLLDDAARLDGLPAMRLLLVDVRKIAEAIGMDPDQLTDTVMALWPDDDTEGNDKS